MGPELNPDGVAGTHPLRTGLDEAVREHLRNVELLRSTIEMLERSARPVVVDANRLRGEIRALAQNGHDTVLVTLTRTGFLRLFAARHVLDEVDRYLEKWARETGTLASAYEAAWVSVLCPLITEVAFPRDLLTSDELARVEVLDLPRPVGDPDDVPTAIAAMVLAAPLLSGDEKPLAAVYGPDVDMKRHDAYLDALFGGGRVLVVSQWGQVALMLARLFGGLVSSGLRALAAKTGAMPLLLGGAAAAGLAFSSERTRAWLVRSKDPLRAAGAAVLEVYAFYQEAEADYDRLSSPLIPDLDALPPHAATAREAARRSALDSPDPAQLVRPIGE